MRYTFILVVLSFALLLAIQVSAESNQPTCDSFLPPSKLGESKQLIQTCATCTFVNLTTIYYPPTNKTILNLNVPMTKFVTTYNYTFNDNNYVGTYIYSTIGDLDGVITQGNVCYEVTPSGTIFDNALSIPLFLPMLLMILMAIFFFILSRIMGKDEYKLTFIIMAGIFMVFSIAFGIVASREVLWGFPLLYNFVNSFYRIFLITVVTGAIVTVLILMFYIVKRTFDSRGYNVSGRSGYA